MPRGVYDRNKNKPFEERVSRFHFAMLTFLAHSDIWQDEYQGLNFETSASTGNFEEAEKMLLDLYENYKHKTVKIRKQEKTRP